MSQWRDWGRVALMAALLVLLFVLGWMAKREIVKQVRQELQQQLAEDVRTLRETASRHRMLLESQIQAIQAHAAVEVERDPVVRANELWRILAVELAAAEGECGTESSTSTATATR